MRYARLRTGLPLTALLVGLAWLAPAPAGDKDAEGFTPLFNGKDFSGWKFFLQGQSDISITKTFTIADGAIICTGKPNGYTHTDKSFKNYILRFDWRYNVPGGSETDTKINSGCLVHISGPHQIWPRSVEVQGMNRDHGRIIAIGPKPRPAGKYDFDAEALKKARKPLGEWNTTEVTCQDGTITSKVNGAQVSTGKGELQEGPIGFQSEGVEIQFRNIKIKEL